MTRETAVDAIRNNMEDKNRQSFEKITRNSYIELLGQNHNFDFNKIGSKSIAYHPLQLRKMRAIYGRRGTFKIQKMKVGSVSMDDSFENIDLNQTEKENVDLDRPADLTYSQ